MGTALGELLSDLISPVSRSKKGNELTECQSTEEMMMNIELANTKVRDRGQTEIMGDSGCRKCGGDGHFAR